MNDWIELKDLQAVAKAHADGWRVEMMFYNTGIWERWDGWQWWSAAKYRGRPNAERKVVRVRACILRNIHGAATADIDAVSEKYWRDCGSFIGWVKGSEWREVEIE